MNLVLISPQELQSLIKNEVQQALSEFFNQSFGSKPNLSVSNVKAKELMDVNELAEHFRISKSTIYQYTSKGLIPFHKFGKKLLFKVSEVEDFLKNPVKYSSLSKSINLQSSGKSLKFIRRRA